MSATRVRVVLEYRNGNGNFLAKRFHPNGFVECRGEGDVGAIEAALLLALENQAGLMEDLKALKHHAPSHD